jgi:hypothetical protein
MMDKAGEEALREIAKAMSEYRKEFFESLDREVEADMVKIEAEGFDPARGRGRGPKWADGV